MCLSEAALEFCGKTKVLFIYTISGNDGGYLMCQRVSQKRL